jgi:predicted AlkP superfamily pyrophosphatase or phosphodiesterase
MKSAILLLAIVASSLASYAAPRIILISLDGATPRLVDQYLASGDFPLNQGLGLLQSTGMRAQINETESPSLTAVGHIAIATGSRAAKNDVIANTFHLTASPFNLNISGFGAPIGGYCFDCGPLNGPGESPVPTAEPIWLRLRFAGKKVVTATWPGGDGIDVRVPGATNNAIVQPSSERTVDYTVPFGAFGGIGAQGFSVNSSDFGPAPDPTLAQLAAAGKTSFSPVRYLNNPLERFVVGTATNVIRVAALDTTDDGMTNYDTLVFFDEGRGIQPGPFSLPSTGPAYVKAAEKKSAPFFIEGSVNRAGCNYYVSRLDSDLAFVRISRTSANFIPSTPAVAAQVNDIHANVGFWAPQPDFRIPERLSPGYGPFPDLELEDIYADLVRGFTDYQARLALHAIQRVPDADLVMIYFEQPDGSSHQFLLTDPRQPTDFTNPNSIGAGQDAAKVARYAQYVRNAYQAANQAVQRIIDAVGTEADGRPKSNVIVTSDHGFEIFHTAVNLNALLLANGIPSTKVRAVTSGPAVNVYISLQGREPNGIVSREEYVVLQQQLVALLHGATDTNPNYTLGAPSVALFDQVHARPLPAEINDPSFGRTTTELIGQDSGDVYAILRVGYNFDGTQTPVVLRQGDSVGGTPILSLPNFYGAHGYDPTLENLSSIFFAAGPDIGRGVLPHVRNIDLTPTIAGMLGVETYIAVDGEPLPLAPLALAGAVSRKTHGSAGVFDLPLAIAGPPSVEGRKADDSGGHTLVFTFNKPLTAADVHLQSGFGHIGSVTLSGAQVVVELADIRDNQVLTLRLDGVTDIYGGTLAATFSVAVLRGDVNGDGGVDDTDSALVKAAEVSGGNVDGATFRADVNVSGKINNADVVQTRKRAAQAEL